MSHVAITAVGADRPGIVAAVTGVLVERGCNLEDTSMSILRGHFAMMLLVAIPDGETPDSLDAALAPVADPLDLVVTVRQIDDDVPASPEGEPWTVSVYGADRPGIVHGIARALAEAEVNVVDLSTRVIGEEEHPVYAMVMEVTLPAGLDGDELRSRLGGVAGDLGVEFAVHPSDADIL